MAVLAACGGGGVDTVSSSATAVSSLEGDRVSTLSVTATSATTASTVWTPCATEGQTCAFTGAKQVRYGVPSHYFVLTLTGGTACSNAVFHDPAVGTPKSCQIADLDSVPSFVPANWTLCAAEGGSCVFDGSRLVRYGTPTQAVTQLATGPTACTNAVFGDPATGTRKSCWYATQAGGVPATVTVPALTTTTVGASAQLVATVLDAAGTVISGATITWTVADPTIATLAASGLATPLRVGFTMVTASVGGKMATGVLTVRGTTPIPTRSQYVGTNLGGVTYYGTNFPFADLVKSSSGWGPSDASVPFPSTSADGYPTALAAGQHALTAVAWSNTHYPAGQYTLLWDGDGTMSFPMSNVRIDSSAPNRIVVEPNDLNAAIWLGIDSTNPSNPVRNVRFLWPGTEATYATQPFNPVYLAKIAPFSLLRFMDWGRTNGSPLVEWADRPLPTNAVYTSAKGVPIEVMIDLANSLHVDPWFCIPHQASDDYVRQFATLLHTRLDPTLRPHIEYSNEVWNTGFAQTSWAVAKSDALGLAHPYGLPSIFYARRSVQIFKAMQQVYGSTDAHRLIRVLAGQAAWTQFLQSALADADTASNADVMAIAPYFGADSADNPSNVAATLGLSASQIVDQMLVAIRGNVKSQMSSNAALAAQYHLKLRAYESGPSDSVAYFPAANQDALTALFAAANTSPRMKDVYTEYYGQWKALGGDTMNQYSDIGAWSKYGFWGALQNVTDDATKSPKYQGLMAFIAANPTTAPQTALKASGSAK